MLHGPPLSPLEDMPLCPKTLSFPWASPLLGGLALQVVAHDREQLTIRNLRQQAAPPPEPPPPLPSGDAHEILWSGSPVGVSSGDGGQVGT